MIRLRKSIAIVALVAAGTAFAQFPPALKIMKAKVITNSNIVFGVGKAAPKTEAEWAAVQQAAQNMVNVSKELMPLGPDSGREAWVQFTQELGAASGKAAAATKVRNVDGVLAAGDAMFAVCEGCHNRYMKK
jgi:cytochrome c556